MKRTIFTTLVFTVALFSCNTMDKQKQSDKAAYPSSVYEYSGNIEPRWISFENRTGEKGKGGMENNGAKGHPSDMIHAGQILSLVDIAGPGIINRMWFTISDRSEYTLRGLVLKMYWDGEEKPAVEVPFGDFFSVGLGKTATFQNALFASPEGRSFNSFVQMPFKKHAKIEIVNELPYDIEMIFYDVDLQLMKTWNDDYMYFHSYWHRDTTTTPGTDFEILPETMGKGRFLGTNISVNANPLYQPYWWGEGEVKIYLNGDRDFPTLVGTGTEDYIGTAWGQSKFFNEYSGCSVADPENLQWSFYRFHIKDPVYFSSDCKVTIQQMGGAAKRQVIEMLKRHVPLIPVTVNKPEPPMAMIFHKDSIADLESPDLPGDEAWTNFYRSDDVAATVYFYLDSPSDSLPEIQPLAIRTWNIMSK